MTNQQRICIDNAIKHLQDARKWLDTAMYYSGEEMPSEDFGRVRASYDKLCEVIDKL